MVAINNNYIGNNYNKNTLDAIVASDVHDILEKDENDNFYFPKHKAIAQTAEKNNIKYIILNGDLLDEDSIVNYLTEDVNELMESYVDAVLSDEDKELSRLGGIVNQVGGFENLKKRAEDSTNSREQIELQYLVSLYEQTDEDIWAATTHLPDC